MCIRVCVCVLERPELASFGLALVHGPETVPVWQQQRPGRDDTLHVTAEIPLTAFSPLTSWKSVGAVDARLPWRRARCAHAGVRCRRAFVLAAL